MTGPVLACRYNCSGLAVSSSAAPARFAVRLLIALISSAVIFGPGVALPRTAAAQDGSTVDDAEPIDEDPIEETYDEEVVWDPIEPVNRGIFWFNDQLDIYLLEPVARGYFDYVPRPIRTGVKNFFRNIKSPVYVFSDLVQLKFEQAGIHTARFLINSTIGVLGVMDVARKWGLEHETEDFGIALGYYGVPEGPYLVLPLLGPSNLRDLVGTVVDGFLDPVPYAAATWDDGIYLVVGLKVVDVVDKRSRLLDAIETGKEGSVDYYLFIQSTYHQVRQNDIYDGAPPDESGDIDDVGNSAGNAPQ